MDLNGRVYDPTVGRFISADPTGGSGLGRYTYGMDSPLVYIDPSGFDDCPPANGDPTVKCNAKLQPVTVTAFPPDFGSGDITSGSGSVPGGPVQGSDGGTINLGDVDVNAKPAQKNSQTSTIELAAVINPAQGRPANSEQNLQKIRQQKLQTNQMSCSTSYGCRTPSQSCSPGPGYLDRYMNFVSNNAINVGPYAAALAGGIWPKSFAPTGDFRPPLLGSSNPYTSVPRAFGMPGADSSIVRAGAGFIGVATVGVGYYDLTVEIEGFLYAIPSQGTCIKG